MAMKLVHFRDAGSAAAQRTYRPVAAVGGGALQWLCRGIVSATPRYFTASSRQAPDSSWPTVAR